MRGVEEAGDFNDGEEGGDRRLNGREREEARYFVRAERRIERGRAFEGDEMVPVGLRLVVL